MWPKEGRRGSYPLHSSDLQCLSLRDPAHMRAYLFWSMLGHGHGSFESLNLWMPPPYSVQFDGDDVADPGTNHAQEIPQKSRKPTPRLASGATVPSSSQAQTPLSSF